ncbi:transport protein particle (TRAPP) subunit [Angomonas deanei]|nr:transport protein particle (TRAPP) subunit [Angomonas deanei]|eukprot:EPY41124.1 transport protein particle (TRAPP) subunit [Angomonas deanei]
MTSRAAANRPGTSAADSTLSGSQGMVSLSAFSFLFTDLCTRAYHYPTKVQNVEEVEARLTQLGVHVGMRLMMLYSVRETQENRRRPLTVEQALKLLQEKLWLRWFGHAANEVQRESGSDRYFLGDSDPLVLKSVFASPDYVDSEGRWTVNYASYMGGIIQGALQSMNFDCEVVTYHQPEPDKPHQSLFVVAFSKHVWDRERKLKR